MLRDPPHYLKPLKSTTTPKRLLWLSTRGSSQKRRNNYVASFHAAALGETHWTAKRHEQRDRLYTFDDAESLWTMADSLCPRGRRVVLFGYDMAEQMRLSQLLTQLPALGWTLDRIVLERSAAWCLLREGNRSLMCCDLHSWCPVPFGKIASDVADPGRNERIIQAGPEYGANLCVYRAGVIRRAVLQILNYIEGENCGPFKPTGSGQSYSAYRRRFLTSKLLVHDDTVRLTAERAAMATGRSEAWRHGRLKDGPYVEYDLHAAYATIGRDFDVPAIARPALARPSPARLDRALGKYAVLADVTVTTSVECVPCVVAGRTIWPVGTFRTWLWDPELTLALDYADSVAVHNAYPYTRAPAIRDFCQYVLDGLEGQTQVYGLVPMRVQKHWSRCLVGRLGLRYRAWHKFGVQSPPDVRLITYLDVDEGTRTEMLLAGSQRLILGDMTESPESLPQVPGWVMSQCRRWLWDSMVGVGLDNVVYVDTDSVIVQKSPAHHAMHCELQPRPSYWRSKGAYSSMTIYGPRNLTVGPDRRVSGVPLTAVQSAPLEFSGEVMRSLKTSMQHGELDSVVTIPREFHLKATDLRRQHNPDGSTSPFAIQTEDS